MAFLLVVKSEVAAEGFDGFGPCVESRVSKLHLEFEVVAFYLEVDCSVPGFSRLGDVVADFGDVVRAVRVLGPEVE